MHITVLGNCVVGQNKTEITKRHSLNNEAEYEKSCGNLIVGCIAPISKAKANLSLSALQHFFRIFAAICGLRKLSAWLSFLEYSIV